MSRQVAASVRVLAGMYGAGTDEVLTTVQMVDPDVRTVVLVGHNPTMEDLALHLVSQDDDGVGGIGGRSWGLRTGAAVVMDVRCPWHDVQRGCGTPRSVHPPRR